jgi:hypothetical protein
MMQHIAGLIPGRCVQLTADILTAVEEGQEEMKKNNVESRTDWFCMSTSRRSDSAVLANWTPNMPVR